MIAGIIALLLTVVGAILIGVGVGLSLSDRKKRSAAASAQIATEGVPEEVLKGTAKLAEALRDYPLGMQLVFIGFALMLAGGALGGVGSIASS